MADTFSTVRIEGSILPPDLLARVAGDAKLDGTRAEDYGLVGEKVNEATNHAWNRLTAAWDSFQAAVQKLPKSDTGTKLTLEKWLLPFWNVLGYGRLEKAPSFVIDEKPYPISHLRYHSPIHLVGIAQDLDKRVELDDRKASPHGLVQEFLNRSDEHLWGFVTNGYKLRILRDNIRLTRQAYVEFDLQAMFEGKQYADFALLWRLCHESRVSADKPEQCWLEKWSKLAAELGLRALDQLRTGVENAVKSLGRGFLACPENFDLRKALKENLLSPQQYYRELLRIIYRFLFLFVAEDRELLLYPDEPVDAKERYRHYYSTARLRRIAEKLRGTPHTDLYEVISQVMTKLGTTGCRELALPALGGLFDPVRTPHLANCRLANTYLLEAIRTLAIISDGKTHRTVDYRNLGAEELGSVYESLLELRPHFDHDAGSFTLISTAGNERKTTGSYYTPTALITCLLDSALDPVLQEAASKPKPEQAILDLKICDPACGSGHFLIAAANRVAKKLASVRTQEDEPAPGTVRHALRDVIGRCIYGVDINPMAVELCQVALWMEALEPGKPLSFLEHHIQCGNSLLGTTPELLADGIPDDAFEPIEGDEKPICRELKKRNKDERAGQEELFDRGEPEQSVSNLNEVLAQLEQLPDDTVDQIHDKERRHAAAVGEANYRKSGHFLSDFWCSAFVIPKRKDYRVVITESLFRQTAENPEIAGQELYAVVRQLAEQYQFFHWHLRFAPVIERGGFDVVLGNPPWERIKLQEQEWFAAHGRFDIAQARTATIRGKLIREIEIKDPATYRAFQEDRRKSEGESHFIRNSSDIDQKRRHKGLFPLCGRGDVNTYSLFAELNRYLINATGRIGCIVPSGIATDDTTKVFFQDLSESQSIVSLLSFFEIRSIFPDTDSRNPFCLLTLTGRERPTAATTFLFDARSVMDLSDVDKHVSLSKDDLRLLNPNTKTCPVFRTRKDADLIKALYRSTPVLVRDDNPNHGGWQVFYLRLVDFGDHSSELNTKEQLESGGFIQDGVKWIKEGHTYLPVYESKLTSTFDHRSASYGPNGSVTAVTIDQKKDVFFSVLPRYWVSSTFFSTLMSKYDYHPRWFLSYRDVARTSDSRTLICTAIPKIPASRKAPVLGFRESSPLAILLLANFNAFVVDYVVRQKMGGTSLAYFILKQLPILPPQAFSAPTNWTYGISVQSWMLPRVLELTYTAWDMKAFAEDVGYSGDPFIWNDDRRFQLRCELDAAFFHLYGIQEPDVDYIMESFPIVKSKDVEKFGNYRTKETILKLYREYARPALSSS
jgi:hypothetical protein